MPKPELVIITGDLVNDKTNKLQWDEFRRITNLISSRKVLVLPGNHDIGQQPSEEALEQFKKMFGSDRFSIKFRNCSFIGFNFHPYQGRKPRS